MFFRQERYRLVSVSLYFLAFHYRGTVSPGNHFFCQDFLTAPICALAVTQYLYRYVGGRRLMVLDQPAGLDELCRIAQGWHPGGYIECIVFA
jgi:hypothetical protein